MDIKAGLTCKELKNQPHDLCCDSGHKAPATFKRNGSGSQPEPTKFFRLSGSISGVYCEPCLIVMNYFASQKRKKNGVR